ncbi:hypothetical protein MAPG_00464 [Magnaporthiopsis poae ATCC 64411]|uniref:Uncharacterized protein n=1 Tax=Magnaporthiopsis poae (strain ATCC 64411 / 73-15) TaxID=644358 RepID=A0A0C4DL29_MAGP6|nr:hypothetical protein MAPG_00464 [Magnaporthiopsis poae ATCC 64411]
MPCGPGQDHKRERQRGDVKGAARCSPPATAKALLAPAVAVLAAGPAEAAHYLAPSRLSSRGRVGKRIYHGSSSRILLIAVLPSEAGGSGQDAYHGSKASRGEEMSSTCASWALDDAHIPSTGNKTDWHPESRRRDDSHA